MVIHTSIVTKIIRTTTMEIINKTTPITIITLIITTTITMEIKRMDGQVFIFHLTTAKMKIQ